MKILGLDPGLQRTGFGLIEAGPGGRLRVLDAGVVKTRASDPLSGRLQTLFEEVRPVIDQADAVAVESLFSVYEHPRTAILMGHARGLLLLAAALGGKPVAEYAPLRVKMALTGYGRASKEQVRRAVQQRLGVGEVRGPLDVSDALALALCHANILEHGTAALAGGRRGR